MACASVSKLTWPVWMALSMLAGGSSVGCSDGPSKDPKPPSVAGACSADRAYDALSYDLSARFDWSVKRLVAVERVSLALVNGGKQTIELDSFVEVKRVHASENNLSFVVDPKGTLRIDLAPSDVGSGLVSFTIEYEAPISDALRASSGRDDDPVTTRVLYTDSEPTDGARWLPANHRPCDRASFSVELSVDEGDDVIANGIRTKDSLEGGSRVVRHEMRDPIPTYTMAFAAGELAHEDVLAGSVPISLWHRRGLVVHAKEILERTAQEMATFTTLMGPYRWQSYALVLLPEFSGGMENTTITFVDESSQQANPNVILSAHELAHQWFGDWVTVQTFDDVWIKEGMATLLAAEADRPRRDQEGKGRLFGFNFGFTPTQAIRDKSLVGTAKYNTGSYQRAAWLLTQIRSVVGEESFWATLRQVLDQRALGSIDSESFLGMFSLDDAKRAKVLGAIDAKQGPAIAAKYVPSTRGVNFTLTDPAGTLLAPIGITVVDADGNVTESELLPDAPLSVTVPVGGYLAPDEKDIHPDWWRSFLASSADNAIAALWFPASATARAQFGTRSAGHQERTLGRNPMLPLLPAEFPGLYEQLDSTAAKRLATINGCYTLASAPSSEWTFTLTPYLKSPASTAWSPWYGTCGISFATSTFGDQFASLATSYDGQTASWLDYLLGFDYGPAVTFATLSRLATQAPSLQMREEAISRLSYQSSGAYASVLEVDKPKWKEFFRTRLQESKSSRRFLLVWEGAYGLSDEGALSIAGAKLRTVTFSEATAVQIVCDAQAIATNAMRLEAFTAFQEAAKPWDTFPARVRDYLANPTRCDVVPALGSVGRAAPLEGPRPIDALVGKY